MTTPARPGYAGHRFPAEAIGHAVWLHFRFPLSPRHIDALPAAHGVTVGHETVRRWGFKFGQAFANRIRRRLPAPGDKWHLDEVEVKIAGEKHGSGTPWTETGSCSTSSSGAGVTKRPPNASCASCRGSSGARRAMVEAVPGAARDGHGQAGGSRGREARGHARRRAQEAQGHRHRAENSHQPTRRRERRMKRFESPGHARRFLAAHGRIGHLFHLRRDHLPAARYRAARTRAFQTWAEVTGIAAIA